MAAAGAKGECYAAHVCRLAYDESPVLRCAAIETLAPFPAAASGVDGTGRQRAGGGEAVLVLAPIAGAGRVAGTVGRRERRAGGARAVASGLRAGDVCVGCHDAAATLDAACLRCVSALGASRMCLCVRFRNRAHRGSPEREQHGSAAWRVSLHFRPLGSAQLGGLGTAAAFPCLQQALGGGASEFCSGPANLQPSNDSTDPHFDLTSGRRSSVGVEPRPIGRESHRIIYGGLLWGPPKEVDSGVRPTGNSRPTCVVCYSALQSRRPAASKGSVVLSGWRFRRSSSSTLR